MKIKSRGFTLIELLIVILIISIAATFAVLATGDFGRSRAIKADAEQFVMLVKLAKERAILQPEVIGIAVNEQGYQFYRYHLNPNTATAKWLAIKDNSVFRQRKFTKNTRIQLQLKSQTSSQSFNTFGVNPQIIITVTGQITPFNLIMGDSSQANLYKILVTPSGTIKLLTPTKP